MDPDDCREGLYSRFPWFARLDVTRQMAVIAVCLHNGGQGLFGLAKFTAAMGRGDYAAAARELVASRWHARCPDAAAVEHTIRTGTADDGPDAA